MKKQVIKLLLKNSLTTAESETLKLLLSSVVNFLDSIIYTEMRQMLPAQQLKVLERNTVFDDISFGVGIDILRLLDETVNSCYDLNTLLIRIKMKINELIIDNERKSDDYKMLNVLDIVAEYMDKPIGD
ncbi:unnamed protein product [Mucor hiemalis]